MGAFDDLHNHFEKNMGNIGATRGIFREGNAARSIEAKDGDIRYMSKDDKEEALKTIADHEENELERTLEGIRRNKEDEKGQPTEKAVELLKDRPRDPNAAYKNAAEYAKRGDIRGDWTEEVARWAGAIAGMKGDTRSAAGSDWRPGMGSAARGTPKYRKRDAIYQRAIARGEDAWNKQKQKIAEKKGGSTQKAMLIEKRMSPALSNLLAAAAGWALSGDTASKNVPPEMAAEWERAQSREDKRRLQEEMIHRMKRMRKSDDGTFLDDLEMLYKDHAPVPPRYGLMWDAVKHRWTRPEKVGRTVWEVQGKKRFRGTGTGVHERTRATRGTGGKGQGSMEAGRRFRSVADAGRTHPHEAKRVGQTTKPRRKKIGGK